MKHGVCDCWCDRDDRRLAGADGLKVGAVEKVDIQLRDILKSRYLTTAERSVEHFAVLEPHLFTQCRPEPHNDGARDLIVQVIGVQDRPALEDFGHSADGDLSLRAIDLTLRARGDKRALFRATGDSDPYVCSFLLRAFLPSESLCRCFENGAQTLLLRRISKVRQTECQRINARADGQLIHEALASEGIGRGRKGPIRALAQWRIRANEAAATGTCPVRSFDCGRAGINIDKVP